MSDNRKIRRRQVLDEFKAIYWKLIQEHPELTVKQVADYYKQQYSNPAAQPQEKVSSWSVDEYKNSVEKIILQRITHTRSFVSI